VPAGVVTAMPRPLVQAAPQKASGKKGLLIGSLVGLVLLGAVAVGGGWYAYTQLAGSPDAAPSPAPSTPTRQSSAPPESLPLASDVPAQQAAANAVSAKPNDSQPATANRTSGPAQAKAPAPKPAAKPAGKKTTGATVIEQ